MLLAYLQQVIDLAKLSSSPPVAGAVAPQSHGRLDRGLQILMQSMWQSSGGNYPRAGRRIVRLYRYSDRRLARKCWYSS